MHEHACVLLTHQGLLFCKESLQSMKRIIRTLWGDLKGAELKKFVLLTIGMFLLIGSFWPLKVLKDSVFINTIGPTYLPIVKIVSLFFFFPLVMGYAQLINWFTRERVLYLVIVFFASVGFLFSFFFSHTLLVLLIRHQVLFVCLGGFSIFL